MAYYKKGNTMSSLKKANPDHLWVMFQRLPYELGENLKNIGELSGLERIITLLENIKGNVTNNSPRTSQRIQNIKLSSLKISNNGISIKYIRENSENEVILKEEISLTKKQALLVIRAVMRTFSKNHGIFIGISSRIKVAYERRTKSNQLSLEMRNGSLKILLKFTSDQERKLFRNQFKEEIEKGQLKAEDSGKGQLSLTLFSQEKKSWKNRENQ